MKKLIYNGVEVIDATEWRCYVCGELMRDPEPFIRDIVPFHRKHLGCHFEEDPLIGLLKNAERYYGTEKDV